MYSKLVLIGALSLTCGVACSQGTKGVHFDEVVADISSGVSADVVGVVTTKNTQPDNSSSVVLYDNDVEIGREGGKAFSFTVRRTVSQAGRHKFTAKCYNERADADTCVVKVTKTDVLQIK